MVNNFGKWGLFLLKKVIGNCVGYCIIYIYVYFYDVWLCSILVDGIVCICRNIILLLNIEYL